MGTPARPSAHGSEAPQQGTGEGCKTAHQPHRPAEPFHLQHRLLPLPRSHCWGHGGALQQAEATLTWGTKPRGFERIISWGHQYKAPGRGPAARRTPKSTGTMLTCLLGAPVLTCLLQGGCSAWGALPGPIQTPRHGAAMAVLGWEAVPVFYRSDAHGDSTADATSGDSASSAHSSDPYVTPGFEQESQQSINGSSRYLGISPKQKGSRRERRGAHTEPQLEAVRWLCVQSDAAPLPPSPGSVPHLRHTVNFTFCIKNRKPFTFLPPWVIFPCLTVLISSEGWDSP